MAKFSKKPSNPFEMEIISALPQTVVIPVRQGIVYRTDSGQSLAMDIYYPPNLEKACAAVLFVTGFPDAGFQKVAGCKQMQTGQYRSWARLIADSGMAAILYENENPMTDPKDLLAYICEQAQDLRLDKSRLAIWACSGNVPNAMALFQSQQADLACGVFCYGYTRDHHGSSHVAEAAAKFRFTNPAQEYTMDNLPKKTPFLLVRAGNDQIPGINPSLDAFVVQALLQNAPISLINHPNAPHAFDLHDDSEASRAVMAHIIAYLQTQLRV